MSDLPLHLEVSAKVAGSMECIFAKTDDPNLLTSHIGRLSRMMGGGSLHCELDAFSGKAVVPVIRPAETALGIAVAADSVVEERPPPFCKAWATIAQARTRRRARSAGQTCHGCGIDAEQVDFLTKAMGASNEKPNKRRSK